MNLKDKNIEELKELSIDLRDQILQTVSKNGGHLSSPIGAVDLIVGMHYVFDAKKDPFIFDVSHQAYAHKLLTDREKEFGTLRQFGGISGYTKPSESPYDYFVAGHSSTSISLAVGAAKAIKLKQEDRTPVAFIGDGSMSAGMVYEALNELGDKKYHVVIILNDNEMSIAKPIGAISKYLSKKMAENSYQRFRKFTEKILDHFPESASYMAKKMEDWLKLITPGMLFEELGIDYIGPIDGHNIEEIIETLKVAKEFDGPVIVHAQTLKGKGYSKAEGYYENWHGVGPFDLKSGEPLKKKAKKNATSLFSDALFELAGKHENVVGVTAAMPSGTGLKKCMEVYPERFWDVAIAEQHAVTSMAALAKEGFKPYIAIYSTFLQRAYDQVIHDCCLMALPVVFAIDRAGIVGEDGETHQGLFDISYLRILPNMTLFAPRDEESMKYAVDFAYNMKTPCAFRYPRGEFFDSSKYPALPYEYGKSQLLKEGKDILFMGYGNGVGRACQTAEFLKDGFDPAILDLVFAKPLDEDKLLKLAKEYKKWYIFSDSMKKGGIYSAILEFLSDKDIYDVQVTSFEYEDEFIEHGNTKKVEESLGLLPEQLAEVVSRES
jgi:1-deoxy-D-xylulose-5-phosphate synthase